MTGEQDYPEVFAGFPVRRPSERGGWDIPCPCKDNHPRGDRRWSARIWIERNHVRFWCGKGCKWDDAVAAVGIPKPYWYANRGRSMSEEIAPRRKEIAYYPYTDAQGEVMYEKVRTDPKGFYHRRPGPGGKGYVYSLMKGWYAWDKSRWVSCRQTDAGAVWLDECRKVPFQWLDIRKREGHPVNVVEGEKSALHLKELGLVAICSPDGAGKWPPEFGGYLAGRDVVIWADEDEPGHLHAAQVMGSAILYRCKSIRLATSGCVEGYKLDEGEDIYDWLRKLSAHHSSIIKQRHVEYEALVALARKLPKLAWISATSR
jgi:hypothetical protein